MLKVRDIMTTDVVSVKRETTIRELAEIFTKHRVGSVPVVDESGNLIGIVTESDLIEQDKSLHIPTVISLFDWVIYLESEKKFEKELQKMTGQTVGDLYTDTAEMVTPDTPVSEVADIMSSKKLHALPVVEGKRLVGMVSRIDLIRTMVK
ncbi:CBS domain containing membrane protein [Geobacter metallireducens RCH3]|uniref:CBS domain pair-containing protein n=1 Tax=Geobacter metallireducens (strain ATCC 53774 / DSM 7210 / GS-15) TaxID=269799 RepID=Q39UG3_GEOMG|nr:MULTISPECIES: CBS domain-containing protein [Geobacter]ABB32111.1 CBS domain pair-containing protein [Geobacter metallireducens GS-15]EHP88700.1 CBS domain containing membrane protein [Geobacter metallireducens RCH3]MBT1074529.1 CBS domain-containing protein [Geobacter grbiciae]